MIIIIKSVNTQFIIDIKGIYIYNNLWLIRLLSVTKCKDISNSNSFFDSTGHTPIPSSKLPPKLTNSSSIKKSNNSRVHSPIQFN